MFKAYADFWKKYVNFTDRATVADYWWAVLCNTIVMVIISIIIFMGLIVGVFSVSNMSDSTGYNATYGISMVILLLIGLGLMGLWLLATLIPNASIMVRRLRDTGLSPWLGLLLLVRYISPIFSIGVLFASMNSAIISGRYSDLNGLSMLSGAGTSLSVLLNLVQFGITIFFFIVSILPSKEPETAEVKVKPVVEEVPEKVTVKEDTDKATTKKSTVKKAEPKKTTAKKSATKKTTSTAKKTAPKKTTSKKTTTKKSEK